MAVALDGPVGVVRPGSWWRTQGAKNFTRDQLKVIGLLAAIPASQGGKKEAWGTSLPPAASDGICATHLADAIWEFQVFWKARGTFQNIDGVVDPGGNSLRKLNELAPGGATPPSPTPPVPPPPPPGPPAEFIVHDVRLFGWKPGGDVLEVNGDTPFRWVLDNTISRGKKNGGNLVLKIMAHGLPGFVQCCQGRFPHPTLPAKVMDGTKYIGPGKGGLTVADLNEFRSLAGHVKRIEFHSCLVARIGPCFEANGHASFDGNQFCFMLAQAIQAEVTASIHLQWFWPGTGPSNGIDFGHWNGLVFTWGPAGNIIRKQQWVYEEKKGPPPPPIDIP